MLRTDCFGVRHNAAATRSIIKIYPSPKYVQENGRHASAVLLFLSQKPETRVRQHFLALPYTLLCFFALLRAYTHFFCILNPPDSLGGSAETYADEQKYRLPLGGLMCAYCHSPKVFPLGVHDELSN